MANQMGSGSSGGGSACSEDNEGHESHNGKKNYHRHTHEQIHRLEGFFKECPHPDENQRRQLGTELGLEPKQIKFWFQNKRTQKKAQIERADNNTLRSEIQRIRCENISIREALKTAVCSNCGGPSSGDDERKQSLLKLQQENTELKLQFDRASSILAKYIGRPLEEPASLSSQGKRNAISGVDGFLSNLSAENLELLFEMHMNQQAEKSPMTEISANAVEELIKLMKADQPLWIKSQTDDCYILDRDCYKQTISRPVGLKYSNSRMESSKGSCTVAMNAKLLVDLFLDPDKCVELFPTVVSKARTIHVLEAGSLGSRNGSLQLMYEQTHILSPLVQPRDFYVLRRCQQIERGIWVIVDVSYDYQRGDDHISPVCYWKHPSGCMIQGLSAGLSKITVIEHVEVDAASKVNGTYEEILRHALSFGAKRWIIALQRLSERYTYLSEACRVGRELGGVAGRKSMIMLACRMVKSYCSIFSSLATAESRKLSELTNDRIQIAIRRNTSPGQPVGIVLSAACCFWVPASPQRVFKFLSDHKSRSQWDVLCNKNQVCEVLHISTGSGIENRISVLQPVSSCENLLIFQESMVDKMESSLVFAPIDVGSMCEVTSGVDSSSVPILASGFTITPDGLENRPSSSTSTYTGGSLVTLAFQILACSSTAKEDVGKDILSTTEAFVNRAIRVIQVAFDPSR